MLIGEGFFGAEHGAHLENAVEASRHGHLLIELGALAEVRLAIEIFQFEHVGTRFAGRADELGGVDFHEAPVQQELAHGGHQGGLGLENQGVAVGAQIDPAVIQPGIDGGVLGQGQRLGHGEDFHFFGQHFHAAQLHKAVFHHGAHGGDYRFHRQLIHQGGQIGMLFLFDGQLDAAGVIPDDQEGHGALIAQVFHKALNFVGFSDFDLTDQVPFHCLQRPFIL